MRTLGVALWTEGRLLVPRAGAAFDQDGTLIDAAVTQQLRTFVAGFVAWIAKR